MQRTNLLLAALVATALSSCTISNDIPAPEPQMIDTYLSITASTGEVKTKSSGDKEKGKGKEDFINKLTALVFYEDGTIAASQTVNAEWEGGEGTSVTEIKNIKVKVSATAEGATSATALKVILLANADVAGITNLASLATTTFGDISQLIASDICKKKPAKDATYLPMSSDIIDVEAVTAGKENWVENSGEVKNEEDEYEEENYIVMYRYVARVQLESLSTAFTDNNANLRFRLDSVALANVSSKSLYAMDEEGGDLYKAGTPFFRGVPNAFDRKDFFISDGDYKPDALSVNYTTAEQASSLIVSNNSPADFSDFGGVPMLYAFEYFDKKEKISDTPDDKGEINTMMIIAGTFVDEFGEPDKIYTGTRYFRIPIKVSQGKDAFGVARNTVYKIKVTLTGEGTKNPDENMLNAMINFSIKVEDWNEVNQEENDSN